MTSEMREVRDTSHKRRRNELVAGGCTLNQEWLETMPPLVAFFVFDTFPTLLQFKTCF